MRQTCTHNASIAAYPQGDKVISQDQLRIGRVVEVTGSRTVGELELQSHELHRTVDGHEYTLGQVGSICRVDTGNVSLFGILTDVRMHDSQGGIHNAPRPIGIEFFGQGVKRGEALDDFKFERGIEAYPLPGQSIHIATMAELKRIYARPDVPSIQVGHVSLAQSIPVHLLLNSLVGKHFTVLGTTGSGKSCTVALIIQRIIEKYPHGHVALIDPHDEYGTAFGNLAERVDPTTMDLPHWLLNFEETVELFVGPIASVAPVEVNIVKEALLHSRKAMAQSRADKHRITVDTPTPYKMGEFVNHVNVARHRVLGDERDPHDRILNRIDTMQHDRRFDFMLKGDEEVKDTLLTTLSQYLRIPTHRKPLSIFDLSGVPSDVVDVVVSVLCRIIFDSALWNPAREEMPILVICEEAHRYVPRGRDTVFQPTKRALSRIAKEGRKYGVGLALVTQRPSELDESVMSQCNTVISMRMGNEEDQEFVKRVLPDSARTLVDSLPTLRTGEAIAVGEGVSVPVRLTFDRVPDEKRPRSADVDFSEAWSKPIENTHVLEQTIKHWRSQNRKVE